MGVRTSLDQFTIELENLLSQTSFLTYHRYIENGQAYETKTYSKESY